jgi:hypothetical protein
MVILQFTYPRTRNLDEWQHGYGARIMCRVDGELFDGGQDGRSWKKRNGNTCYAFIEMGRALRSLHSNLQYVEGTHHRNN